MSSTMSSVVYKHGIVSKKHLSLIIVTILWIMKNLQFFMREMHKKSVFLTGNMTDLSVKLHFNLTKPTWH